MCTLNRGPVQGETVTPLPGFVIKTSLVGPTDTRKVFINVCQAPQVAKPAPKAKLDDDGNEQQVGCP